MMQRIGIHQLSKIRIKKNLLLVSYQDKDLMQDFCQSVLTQQQIDDIESIDIQTSADWETLCLAHQNYRLFPEPKAYILYFDKGALNTKQLPQLQFSQDDLYILATPIFKHQGLDKLIQENKPEWFGLYSPFNHDLWTFFQTELLHQGYKLAPEIRSWWSENSFSYIQVKQLLEKLRLQYPEAQAIDLDDIQTHLGLAENPEIQDLIDAWMNQHPEQILNHLDKLKTSDLSLVIWILQRNLCVLEALATHPSRSQEIFQKHKIWPKQTAAFIQLNQYLSKDKLAQLICALQEVDKHFKSHEIAIAMQKLSYIMLFTASLKQSCKQ